MSEIRFDGRVAVITGAGGGLGRAYALLLASRGAKVVVNDLGGTFDGVGSDTAAAQKVVDEIKALGGEAVANFDSVSQWESAVKIIQTAVDHYGKIDILINNAGILRDKSLMKMEIEDYLKVMAVHLNGTFFCTKAPWPVTSPPMSATPPAKPGGPREGINVVSPLLKAGEVLRAVLRPQGDDQVVVVDGPPVGFHLGPGRVYAPYLRLPKVDPFSAQAAQLPGQLLGPALVDQEKRDGGVELMVFLAVHQDHPVFPAQGFAQHVGGHHSARATAQDQHRLPQKITPDKLLYS